MLSALIAAQLALLADKALVLICGRLSAAAFGAVISQCAPILSSAVELPEFVDSVLGMSRCYIPDWQCKRFSCSAPAMTLRRP